MVAEHLAVVAGENEDGVRGTQSANTHHQAAQHGVDVVDEAVVGGPGRQDFLGVQDDFVRRHAVSGASPVLLGPVTHERIGDPGAEVTVEVVLGRLERGMRRDEADREKEGAGGITPSQETHGAVHSPVAGMQVLVQMPWSRGPVVVHDTDLPVPLGLGAGRTVLGEPFLILAEVLMLRAAQDLVVVEAVELAARVLMEVPAHVIGLVPILPQFPRERGHGIGNLAARVGDDPVLLGRLPGKDRTARGNTHRAAGVEAGEPDPVERDVVHRRRLEHRMVRAAQTVAALLVGMDEYDVGFVVH